MTKEQKPFNRSRIIFYLVIILLIGAFFSKNTIDFQTLSQVNFNSRVLLGILFGICMLLIRDLGYILRLLLLTDYKISVPTAIRIIFMWEFGSAITPGMIGGKAVAVYLLIKNKIRPALASSLVLLAILLDEFVFVLIFPIVYYTIGNQMLHGDTSCPDWAHLIQTMPVLKNIEYLESLIFITLGAIFIFVTVSFLGIFVYPRWVKNQIIKISKWKFLQRWSKSIAEFGEDIFETSRYFRQKPTHFWVTLTAYTLLSWIGRYMVGVAIVWGFSSGNFEFLPIYAKQYALWLMFYLPTTPGSSGIAEALYMAFYCQYIIPGLSGAAALIWRIISYYIYLVFGLILVFVNPKKQEGI